MRRPAAADGSPREETVGGGRPAHGIPEGARTYLEAFEAVIEAKAEGRRPPEPRTADEEQGGQVVDLMAALQESVRKAQAARGEDSGDAKIHEMPESKPKKKTAAAKKPPAPWRLTRPARCPAASGQHSSEDL
ncbi:hypothetical protein ACIOTI_31695 [Streptomyces sp. NPDC087843]|uniref:hypothetical protein n=1 Tax=Streptomyces sp. NPDC087843 TaxID=3365804 RepID=UPI00380F9E79